MKYAITAFAIGFIMLMNTVSYSKAIRGETISPAAQVSQLSYENQVRLTR